MSARGHDDGIAGNLHAIAEVDGRYAAIDTFSTHEDVRTPEPVTAVQRATLAFKAFMDCLGLDTSSEHLSGTPRRVAQMYARELFNREGYSWTTFAATTGDLVLVRDIPFSSTCAHHFLPFRGVAHVGYIPDARMVGLSKLARVVDWCSHAPQVQERLTDEIARVLQDRLQPVGLAVVLEAEHMCMSVRGVLKPGATTVTSSLRGMFKESDAARAELMSLVLHGR